MTRPFGQRLVRLRQSPRVVLAKSTRGLCRKDTWRWVKKFDKKCAILEKNGRFCKVCFAKRSFSNGQLKIGNWKSILTIRLLRKNAVLSAFRSENDKNIGWRLFRRNLAVGPKSECKQNVVFTYILIFSHDKRFQEKSRPARTVAAGRISRFRIFHESSSLRQQNFHSSLFTFSLFCRIFAAQCRSTSMS